MRVDFAEFEDEISDAISDSIDMDWTSRDGAKAVVRLLNEQKLGDSAWLIEQDAAGGWPVWFTAKGPEWRFSRDANEALRFSRQEDAEQFIRWIGASPTLSNPRATEHKWIAA